MLESCSICISVAPNHGRMAPPSLCRTTSPHRFRSCKYATLISSRSARMVTMMAAPVAHHSAISAMPARRTFRSSSNDATTENAWQSVLTPCPIASARTAYGRSPSSSAPCATYVMSAIHAAGWHWSVDASARATLVQTLRISVSATRNHGARFVYPSNAKPKLRSHCRRGPAMSATRSPVLAGCHSTVGTSSQRTTRFALVIR
mmetsp:Transcript_52465/g.161520  ORF Transcript_52465/g.161520 Transcript_52465/m.161520 type:complete len:204 (+) Transcript_52465:832-1443(+)